jgi:hypothetical protein
VSTFIAAFHASQTAINSTPIAAHVTELIAYKEALLGSLYQVASSPISLEALEELVITTTRSL